MVRGVLIALKIGQDGWNKESQDRILGFHNWFHRKGAWCSFSYLFGSWSRI